MRNMIHATYFLAADIDDNEISDPPRYDDRAGSIERMRRLGFSDQKIEKYLGVRIPTIPTEETPDDDTDNKQVA